MIIVLDANVLLRLADATSSFHPTVVSAVFAIRGAGDTPVTFPQSIYEFWVVATRPIANNGLGLSIAECSNEIAGLEVSFPVLDDKPTLFKEWKTLVRAFSCHGKVAHDARYVASMPTHGLSHLLTFNVTDFTRYSGLVVLDPQVVAGMVPPSTPP